MKIWKITALAFGTLRAVQLSNAADMDAVDHDPATGGYEDHALYQANELSLDLFGTGSIGEDSIEHWSGDRFENDSRLGAGVGLNYFFTRNVGIGADAYTENTRHFFVDSVAGNLLVRFPIGETAVAPYILGGGGHQFDPREQWFGDAGAGVEFRMTHHFGIFLDARYVVADKTQNYGLGRAGFRFAF